MYFWAALLIVFVDVMVMLSAKAMNHIGALGGGISVV